MIQAASRYHGGPVPIRNCSSRTLAGTADLAEVGSVEAAASAISISLAIRQTMIPSPPASSANTAKPNDQSQPCVLTVKKSSKKSGYVSSAPSEPMFDSAYSQ